MPEIKYYSTSPSDRIHVEATVIASGNDLTVVIGGGDESHVGAIALGVARPPCEVIPKRSATISSICAYDHRDDELARLVAKLVATALDCRVCVSAGVHIDRATPDEVIAIMDCARELGAQIAAGEGTRISS